MVRLTMTLPQEIARDLHRLLSWHIGVPNAALDQLIGVLDSDGT